MPNISTLTVRMSANSSKLVAEFNVAQRRAKTFADRVRGSLTFVKRAFGALATTGAIALVGLTRAGTQTADTLAKTADKLGLAASELAGLRFAAEQTGVGVKQLDLGLQRMVRRVAEAAQGTGEAKNALKELNLNAKELTRLSPDEQFRRVADAFGNVATQSDKVRLGFKLFDSEGVGLVNTLKEGRAGLDAFRREAEDLGLTLERVQLDNIEEAADAQNRLSKAFSGLGQQLAATFAPAMKLGSDATADFVASITRALPKMAGFASAAFGMSRAIEDLTMKEVRAEFIQVEDAIVKTRSRLIELQAVLNSTDSGFAGPASTEDIDRLQFLGEELARLVLRSSELQQRFKSTKEETTALTKAFGQLPSGGGDKAIKMFEEASRVLDEVIAKQERLQSSAASIFAQTRTPIENYISALKEARELLRKGLIDQETFDRFEAQWQDKVIGSVEDLERVAKNSTEEVNKAAKELGLTFSSAFEDAIVEGKKLRDVLKGILQDILRIIVRRQIVEPLANAITGIFSPKAPPSPVPTPPTISRSFFGGGGTITPVVNQSYSIAAGADWETLQKVLPPLFDQNREKTIADIKQMTTAGRF